VACSARNRNSNWGIYAIADQALGRGANLFLRGGYAPGERNLVSFYLDGGIGFKGPIGGRPDDVLIFGAAYARISPDAAVRDRQTLSVAGLSGPVRDEETVVELSYAEVLTPWLTLQPDLQYIVHPGGHIPRPDDPAHALDDALVAGMRMTLVL
jgi:porin